MRDVVVVVGIARSQLCRRAMIAACQIGEFEFEDCAPHVLSAWLVSGW